VDVEVSAHLTVYRGREAMCVVARDITERKKAEKEKGQLEKQLRQAQKMEAIGQLTAGIAHNFNNMLTAIMGNIELAMPGVSRKLRVYLEEALKASEKAADMVNEMQLFSRDLDIERRPVHVYPIVYEVVEICRKIFDRKIELELEAAGDLPPIYSDPGQLRQMVMHLCINARDALESLPAIKRLRHVVKVNIEKVHIDEQNAARHSQAKVGDYIRISVTDNGIGMSEETQRRIFEPFFTTKGVDKGTGLGLSTVYAIAQQHQGWVEVESAVYMGTCFEVYLSLGGNKEPAGEAEENGSSFRGTETILVIDDEEGVRSMLRTILKKHGYKVIEAADGKEGLEILYQRQAEIDLVLLDLSLPAMSGEEVLEELRVRNPDLNVVICTGYSTTRGHHFLGANEVIEKPFKVKKLMTIMRQVLDS
jgi:two-component system cell cycle sensor histidine kinase/response regulator CckA